MFLKSIGFFISVLAVTALACGLSIGANERGANERGGQERGAESAAEAPASASSAGDAAEGERLFNRMGCSGCHNGSGQPAPSLAGVFGAPVTLESGETVAADEAYLRQSILNPKAQMVDGYEPIMPEYGDQLSDAQVQALIAYIRSLGK